MLSWYNPFYLLNETASWMFTQAEYKGQVDIEEWMKKYIMINNQKHRMVSVEWNYFYVLHKWYKSMTYKKACMKGLFLTANANVVIKHYLVLGSYFNFWWGWKLTMWHDGQYLRLCNCVLEH